MRTRRPILRVAALVAFALACAGFLALGAWQIERRAQKHALIERVDARVHAPPVPAPGPSQWAGIDATQYEYRHVRLLGRFLDERASFVHASTALGMGYWVLTPLQQSDGSVVLVNRGFVAAEQRGAPLRAEPGGGNTVAVTGLLRMSEPGGTWLRANRPGEDAWYTRDVAAIAARRGIGPVAPFFVDADATTPDASAGSSADTRPLAGLTVVVFPDNHLVYALTWLALALMSAAAGVRCARPDTLAARARAEDA